MGLFSWLFGKPPRVASRDVIWLTDAARRRGAADAVAAHLGAGRPVLVLAQFPATLAAFGEQVVGRGWPHLAVPSELTPAAALKLASEPRVLFGLVRNLKPDEFPPPDTAPPSPLPVVVLERHLLRAHDDRVTQFAEGLGSRAAVEYHVSMDDPLMALFAGEWVTNALRSLGMKESESIDSAMVGRRIEQAQAKIAKSVTLEQDADSAAEWLERNRAT
ncbi:preprotein translocase subunit : Preprotein translocase subunit SecA OS=Rhodopirellula sp. SWK7 GN=RRSWK_06967 PE=4 SV=1 [Gemmataceae bacterium]|nr:preprotein translocase subunit : Preprotein translocase subunit SecA OS=Rhodopirellula sp. SWK7 GN=RRSWK_06967 PE=4 SV=1 [Gemmataceae bacterium]VTU00523.1 preprotein translocase subunit : Preprotein translocase subunit SecA OS=Rhodopirellula sp. SWK7 GN=RRSWK_06967 PE=4 SV=1 [Gemmataceae bacterium]